MKLNSKAKSIKQAVFWGIFSIAAYLLVFMNEGLIMSHTTLGGAYAAAVIAIAFAFSFVHGTFANFLVEAMGFKAIKQSKGGH